MPEFINNIKRFFDYALVQTGSQAETSIMIGDNWENDILGAHDAGLSQGFTTSIQV